MIAERGYGAASLSFDAKLIPFVDISPLANRLSDSATFNTHH